MKYILKILIQQMVLGLEFLLYKFKVNLIFYNQEIYLELDIVFFMNFIKNIKLNIMIMMINVFNVKLMIKIH